MDRHAVHRDIMVKGQDQGSLVWTHPLAQEPEGYQYDHRV